MLLTTCSYLQQAAQHQLMLLVSESQNLFKCYCYCNSCVWIGYQWTDGVECTFKACAKYHSDANNLCSSYLFVNKFDLFWQIFRHSIWCWCQCWYRVVMLLLMILLQCWGVLAGPHENCWPRLVMGPGYLEAKDLPISWEWEIFTSSLFTWCQIRKLKKNVFWARR